jgi:hypothetical protein
VKLSVEQLRALRAMASGSPFGDTIARRTRWAALQSLVDGGLVKEAAVRNPYFGRIKGTGDPLTAAGRAALEGSS